MYWHLHFSNRFSVSFKKRLEGLEGLEGLQGGAPNSVFKKITWTFYFRLRLDSIFVLVFWDPFKVVFYFLMSIFQSISGLNGLINKYGTLNRHLQHCIAL